MKNISHHTNPATRLIRILPLLVLGITAACSPQPPASQPENTPLQTATFAASHPTPTFPSETPTASPSPLPSATPTQVTTSSEDGNLPLEPSSEWASFHFAASGLSFMYPDNWFIEIDERNNRVRIHNAPPDSVIAIKGSSQKYHRIDIDLSPTQRNSDGSLLKYIEENILANTPPENIVSIGEEACFTPNCQIVHLVEYGMGEISVYFIDHDTQIVSVRSSYAPGKADDFPYLYTTELIAHTVTCCTQREE